VIVFLAVIAMLLMISLCVIAAKCALRLVKEGEINRNFEINKLVKTVA